uniref:Rab11 family-interacting protein 5 n=1 Tax=Erpetoichthys calabaricus TaxID=27687 RepID=A0A8C4RT34_ERPCA
MSLLGVDDEQRWLPTHVQVTVLRARGLRAKGKHGTSDVYTIMQLGKEKYCTSVKEKELNPEWMEECSFELHPGVLEGGPPGGSDLLLTVMHRALIGMDSFLGQVVVPLDRVFQERMSRKNEWFKLHSKVGKKEKERGEIQVTVQFTRNNLTASMYDLSIKDKPRSTLGKLKDKMKGKKSTESSSAIVPSAFGALSGKGGREIDEDDEEDDEQHEEGKRSKVKGFFKKQRLRKSSDTHSNASVASTNSVSSSPGGSLSPTAGISVVVSDLSNSPSLSSNLTVDSPIHTAQSSPKLQTHKRAFSDEVNQTGVLLQPKEVQNLKSKGEPLSKSSLCINGSHVYTAAESTVLPGAMGVLQKSSPLSRSLQNLPKKGDDSHKADHDGRRWSLEKPKKNNDAKSPINLGEMAKEASLLGHPEGKPVQIATPIISIGNEKQTEEGVKEEHKKNKLHLFSHGSGSKSDSVKSTEHGSPSPPHKTWFGSKDSQHKPSPHPVKPLNTSVLEKHDSGVPTGLDKLKSTIQPIFQLSHGQHKDNTVKAEIFPESAAQYYHLTHDELILLLLQKEAELEKTKMELQKKMAKVSDLEEYIDTLLVRIMEQTPALLQVPVHSSKSTSK